MLTKQLSTDANTSGGATTTKTTSAKKQHCYLQKMQI